MGKLDSKSTMALHDQKALGESLYCLASRFSSLWSRVDQKHLGTLSHHCARKRYVFCSVTDGHNSLSISTTWHGTCHKAGIQLEALIHPLCIHMHFWLTLIRMAIDAASYSELVSSHCFPGISCPIFWCSLASPLPHLPCSIFFFLKTSQAKHNLSQQRATCSCDTPPSRWLTYAKNWGVGMLLNFPQPRECLAVSVISDSIPGSS